MQGEAGRRSPTGGIIATTPPTGVVAPPDSAGRTAIPHPTARVPGAVRCAAVRRSPRGADDPRCTFRNCPRCRVVLCVRHGLPRAPLRIAGLPLEAGPTWRSAAPPDERRPHLPRHQPARPRGCTAPLVVGDLAVFITVYGHFHHLQTVTVVPTVLPVLVAIRTATLVVVIARSTRTPLTSAHNRLSAPPTGSLGEAAR